MRVSGAIRSALLLAGREKVSDGLLLRAAMELDDVEHVKSLLIQHLAVPGTLSESQLEFLRRWCGFEVPDADYED